jgi:hypothetical protein
MFCGDDMICLVPEQGITLLPKGNIRNTQPRIRARCVGQELAGMPHSYRLRDIMAGTCFDQLHQLTHSVL